jgi:hypothetical protein
MPQMGMGVLLHAGILSFDQFEICGGRIINAFFNLSRKIFLGIDTKGPIL